MVNWGFFVTNTNGKIESKRIRFSSISTLVCHKRTQKMSRTKILSKYNTHSHQTKNF